MNMAKMYVFIPLMAFQMSLFEKSKKIRNDQELIQSDPIYPALKTQREITKYTN